MKPVLEALQINKYFYNAQTQHVLKDVSFSIEPGEFVSIVGKSGCGKSTLLYILSTMDTDYQGELLIDGQPMRGRIGRPTAPAPAGLFVLASGAARRARAARAALQPRDRQPRRTLDRRGPRSAPSDFP